MPYFAPTNTSGLQAQITVLQGDVITINNNLTQVNIDITNLQGDVTVLQGDVLTLQGDVSVLQGDMATAQADILSLDARVTVLENAILNLGRYDANGEYAGAGNFNVTALTSNATALMVDFDNNGAQPYRIGTNYQRTGFTRPGTMANFQTFGNLDSGRVFGSGNGAVPYYTDNNGVSWTATTGLASGGAYYVASNGAGVAVAAQQGSANVYRSTNNGASWSLDTSSFGVNSQGVNNCRYNAAVGLFMITKIGNVITSATGTGWSAQAFPGGYGGTYPDLTQAACCEWFDGNFYVTDMDSNRVLFGPTLATLTNLNYSLSPGNAYNITYRGCRVMTLHQGRLVWANDTTSLVELNTSGVSNIIAAPQFDTNISAFDVITSFNGEIWRPIKQVFYRNLRTN